MRNMADYTVAWIEGLIQAKNAQALAKKKSNYH